MIENNDNIRLNQVIRKSIKIIPRLPGFVKSAKLMRLEHQNQAVGIGPCIEEIAKKNPRGTAILFEERKISYRELNNWSNRIGKHFIQQGFKKGDVVGVFVQNRPELLAIITGLNKVGIVAALVNTSQRQKVLLHSFNMVSPKANIIGEELLEPFNEVIDDIDCKNNYFYSDCDTLSDSHETPEGFDNFEHAISKLSSSNLEETQNSMPSDVCFYIYTSGTTGLPKAVAFTNGRWLKAYAGFGYTALCLNKKDVLYVTLPFYHATALVICWGSVLAGQSTLALRRSFSASEFWNDIRRFEATGFGYVGELCRYLMNQAPLANDKDNKVLKIVGNGLRPNIWGDFKKRFGIDQVFELYASSEGNIGMLNLLNFDNTVGVCLFPYALVKYDQDAQAVVKNSDGRYIPVKPGEPGLLITKITKLTQPASYTDPKKTAELVLKDVFRDGDRWFNTGDMMRDIGYRHLQFVDRLGDTFRWKGENVSTTELENIINEFDPVEESVVYGVEIPGTNGRAGMAVIVPTISNENFDASLDGLFSYLKGALPAYAVPIFLRIKNDLDMTGTFKYKKSDLKKEAFNPKEVNDALYVCLPKTDSFRKIDQEIYQKLISNEYQF